ncbi:MAG: DapH/DapD/GlmU-related protein [Candidatus Daviesbacteria bacterium]|nr:DapH/DapD/GlmU-related protein [Candidatus Daviesbacteria bacterium]
MSLFKDRMGKPLSTAEASGKVINRLFNYVLDFELLLVTWAGFVPSHLFRLLIYTLAGVKIGKGSRIHIGAKFFYPANIKIGEDSILGNNIFLDGRDKLIIGNHVDIASEVMVYNSKHDINSEDFHAISAPVEIGDYVFIGPRAIILPGIKIGKGAVVAAGAVVTKDVGEFQIVGGVPAEAIGERKMKDLHYKLGRARLFQ